MKPPAPLPGEPPVNGDLARALGISAREWRAILRFMGRTPTYTELGMFSVMWSEHCSYKHSRRMLAMYPRKSRIMLQGPGENAGGVLVDKGIGVLLKIECHNHPSIVSSYQRDATGEGWLWRSILSRTPSSSAAL